MQKGLRGIAVLLVALLAILAGCGGSGGSGTSSSSGGETKPAASAKPIKIGQVIPITGEAAESGKYSKQGAELAVEEVNKAGGVGGRPLQLVQEDDKTTNPGAVAALQKLLENKEIPVIIGSIRSTQVQAMLPTIDEAKIPVAIGGTNYGLTHSNSKWVFRFRPHDGMSAKVMAKFVAEEVKAKKVAVVHATDAFGNGGRDMVVAALKELKLEPVTVQGYNNGEKDFTATISAIKQSGADAMVSYMTFSTDLGILAKQIKQQGLNIKWIGSPSITALDGRNLAGDALYGTYGVTDFHVEGSQKAKDFAAAYKAKYGVLPDLYASWTYDAILVMAEAMKKAPDLKPDAIRKALLAIKGFQGAEFEYTFDENGDGLDHYHIVQNVNGDIKLSKTLRVSR